MGMGSRLPICIAAWILKNSIDSRLTVPSVQQAAFFKRLKPGIFLICLLPLGDLIYRGITGQLDAEPVKDITGVTGQWALRLLLITLSVTPLRQITGWYALIKLRRMLGLFAFFYASLHFLTYLVLDQFFAWDFIIEDITERPYILIGLTALILLIPLAVTSTNGWVKRLGGRRWQKLHTMVYGIAVLGLLHHFLGVKADITGPAVYALILTVLLGYRWYRHAKQAGKAHIKTA